MQFYPSINQPTVPRCAGFFNVLRALISYTSALVPASKRKSWGWKLFINRFFACLVLRIHNSIFSLPKLRNVGFKIEIYHKENNKWIYEAFENTDEIPLHSLGAHFSLSDAYTDVEFEGTTGEAWEQTCMSLHRSTFLNSAEKHLHSAQAHNTFYETAGGASCASPPAATSRLLARQQVRAGS